MRWVFRLVNQSRRLAAESLQSFAHFLDPGQLVLHAGPGLFDGFLQLLRPTCQGLEEASVDQGDRGVVRHSLQHALIGLRKGARLLTCHGDHTEGLLARPNRDDQRRLSETSQLELLQSFAVDAERFGRKHHQGANPIVPRLMKLGRQRLGHVLLRP